MPARGDYAQLFGARLRELRTAADLSQRELAKRCGTSAAAISNFEAGNNSPTLGTLVRLAEAMGCNVTELVEVLDRNYKPSRRPRRNK
ncbi:MAG TPA: helix-turn-helix transcriptional regulator [Thermoanaerobaculia bacterium]